MGDGDRSPLTGNVKRLSKMYPKISTSQNAELRLRWCQIILKNNLEAEYSKVKDFLHSQVCPWAVVAVPSSVLVGREGHGAQGLQCQRDRGWLLLLTVPQDGLGWKRP